GGSADWADSGQERAMESNQARPRSRNHGVGPARAGDETRGGVHDSAHVHVEARCAAGRGRAHHISKTMKAIVALPVAASVSEWSFSRLVHSLALAATF